MLLNRDTPTYIVCILVYWYVNQTVYVRWGSSLSAPFQVSNGVCQGGIYNYQLLFLMFVWMI